MITASLAVLAAAVAFAGTANAKIPPPYKSCKQVNARYPHGVGKVGARDHHVRNTGDIVQAQQLVVRGSDEGQPGA